MLVVIREAKKLFSVICDNSQSKSSFFREKLLPKDIKTLLGNIRDEYIIFTFSSLIFLLQKLKVLSSKEKIRIDAWPEI